MEEIRAWLEHPVTGALRRHLKTRLLAWADQWASGHLLDLQVQGRAQELRNLGRLLNLTPAEIQNEFRKDVIRGPDE